jgi:putative FmdB family regulatory protein
MPWYDYLCLDCGTRFDVQLSYSEYGKRPVRCPECKGRHVRRPVPRVRLAKSEDSRLESMESDFSDPSALEGLEHDPQSMGRMLRKMSQQMGEEMPAGFDEVTGRLEKGESPEAIEKSMPDLGGLEGDGGDEP